MLKIIAFLLLSCSLYAVNAEELCADQANTCKQFASACETKSASINGANIFFFLLPIIFTLFYNSIFFLLFKGVPIKKYCPLTCGTCKSGM